MTEIDIEDVGRLVADSEAQSKLSGLKSSKDELRKRSASSPKKQQKPESPLPWKTIFVLACCLVSEAVTSNVVFPFVGFMVDDFHIASDRRAVGFYAGFLASSYFLAQLCCSFFYGWLSDRIGRRPVLLFGMAGSTAMVLFFGMSPNIWWAIAVRLLTGLLNGNVGVAKTYMAEITDETNQSRGFGILSTLWGIGNILGPVIGGFLAKPASKPWLRTIFAQPVWTQYSYAATDTNCTGASQLYWRQPLEMCMNATVYTYQQVSHSLQQACCSALEAGVKTAETECTPQNVPGAIAGACAFVANSSLPGGGLYIKNVLTGLNFWVLHPYVLPCCVSAVITLAGLLTGLFFLPETLKKPDHVASNEGYATVSTDDASASSELGESTNSLQQSTSSLNASSSNSPFAKIRHLLSQRKILLAVSLYTILGFSDVVFEEVFPLWSLQDPKYGGLGFKTNDIGMTVAIASFVVLGYQLWLCPKIERLLGPLASFQLGYAITIPTLALFPTIHYLTKFGSPLVVNIGATIAVLLYYLPITTVFINVFIMIANSCKRNELGSVNGIAQSTVALTRALAPISGGIILSWSLKNGMPFPFNFYFVFLFMAVVHSLNCMLSYLQPESINQRAESLENRSQDELPSMGH